MKRLMVAGLLACAATAAHAQLEPKMIGNWMVSSETAPSGSGRIFTAVTSGRTMALSVRCIAKRLNLTLFPVASGTTPRAAGDQFRVRFRVDALPDLDTNARALDTQVIQIDPDKRIVKAIRDAREIVVRLTAPMGVTEMLAYDAAGAQKALVDVIRECPLD
jgi:hypothetical protein